MLAVADHGHLYHHYRQRDVLEPEYG